MRGGAGGGDATVPQTTTADDGPTDMYTTAASTGWRRTIFLDRTRMT